MDHNEIVLTIALALIAAVGSFFGSSGYWLWKASKEKATSAMGDMLRGLGHEKIRELGMKYINRGWVTTDEYEDLYNYLWLPYEALQGNGTAKKIVNDVSRLKMIEGRYVPGGEKDETKS